MAKVVSSTPSPVAQSLCHSWCVGIEVAVWRSSSFTKLSPAMESRHQVSLKSKSAISKLDRGDIECGTKALMLADMLNSDVSR